MKIEYGRLYLADLNPRFGTEPGKTRPVVVLQTNNLNRTDHPSTFVVPCTTRMVGSNLLRVFLPKGVCGNKNDCEAMIDQGRAIDNRRLIKALRKLPSPILNDIKDKLRLLLEL
jgi:mRNA interferase MazF